jgi:hypothetical protein
LSNASRDFDRISELCRYFVVRRLCVARHRTTRKLNSAPNNPYLLNHACATVFFAPRLISRSGALLTSCMPNLRKA